jgi:NAD dependent epimerase/dehydratase
MNWKGKRVLVTGAGGFIGSHLCERLAAEGASVRALVHYNARGSWGWLDDSPCRRDVDVVAGDICDNECVRRAMDGTTVVFHLAALIAIPYSYIAPLSYLRTNVEGTHNVLQCARSMGVERCVHTSTSEVYGTARYTPIDESHPLQGQSPYSASKIGADKIAEAYGLSFGVPIVTVRPFNTFGPRQSARAVIPTIILQCLIGDEVRLGNMNPTRDMNYVSNTIDGYLCAASAPEAVGKTFNLGSGQEISIGELARVIGTLSGRDVRVRCEKERLRPEKSEVNRLIADHSLAKSLLGWMPRIGLEDGLSRTIEWMRDNIGRYRIDKYNI